MTEPTKTDISVRLERAALVGIIRPAQESEDSEAFEELKRLAESAGAVVACGLTQRRKKPDSKFYIGKGKVEELKSMIQDYDADLVIANDNLRPGQAKAMEDGLSVKVVDRTELILDIFATQARSQTAKLQVQLAQLVYMLPRLKRMWTHLSRMEGGIGMRGPGETQIESDRRAAKNRIRDLTRKLKEMEDRRERTVESREGNFRISIVGYTNSGKSTLLNRLTDAGVLVQDRLFSTLDTKTKIWRLRGGRVALLSDTVGFIRALPHSLVASFHATLEETRHADLLLHVVDLSASDVESQIRAVEDVLKEIGASGTEALMVFNKADLPREAIDIENLKQSFKSHVVISALTGAGIDDLEKAVSAVMDRFQKPVTFTVPHGKSSIAAMIRKLGRVTAEEYTDDAAVISAFIDPAEAERLKKLIGGQ